MLAADVLELSSFLLSQFLPTQHNLSNSPDLKELAVLLQSKDPLRTTEHTHTETDNMALEEK